MFFFSILASICSGCRFMNMTRRFPENCWSMLHGVFRIGQSYLHGSYVKCKPKLIIVFINFTKNRFDKGMGMNRFENC